MAENQNGMTTGLTPNVASALCYIPVIGWIVAIVLFIIEKNTQVKWHAVQALLLSLVLAVLGFVLGATIILAILVPVLWIAGLVLQLVLAVKAYQGGMIRLPLIADWSDKIVKKV